MCASPKTILCDLAPRTRRAHAGAVALVLLTAAALRLAALDAYPLPIHQDELSDVYDGYSLATTGADRWGEPWPIILRGMGPGDYHPPMYAYCAAIATKVLGLSVWAGRLPAAIAGVLTVLLVYLTARRLLPPSAALLALLFITFSPIHVLYSRQAHQGACMMPFVVILCLYLGIRLLESLRGPSPTRQVVLTTIATGLAIGLSTNAYAAMRLVAPLLGMAIAAAVFFSGSAERRPWQWSLRIVGLLALTTVLGAAPQLYAAVTQPDHFFTRSSATIYPLSNGAAWWVTHLGTNLLRELDPRYLFLSFGEYRFLSVARLSALEMPFLYAGLVMAMVLSIRRRDAALALLAVAVLICLLPSILTRGGPSPMRSSGVWAIYPILSALGVFLAGSVLASAVRRLDPLRIRRGCLLAAGIGVAGVGAYNVQRYLSREALHGPASQQQLVKIGQWLANEDLADYERIYIDAEGMFAYLYTAAFAGIQPSEFQSLTREGTLRGLGWEEYERLGRFHFKSPGRARTDRRAFTAAGKWLIVTCKGTHLEAYELGDQHLVDREP